MQFLSYASLLTLSQCRCFMSTFWPTCSNVVAFEFKLDLYEGLGLLGILKSHHDYVSGTLVIVQFLT